MYKIGFNNCNTQVDIYKIGFNIYNMQVDMYKIGFENPIYGTHKPNNTPITNNPKPDTQTNNPNHKHTNQ